MFRPLDDRQRCSRAIVAVIVVVALSIRLAWALTRPTDPATLENLPDQVEYVSIAQSLLARDGFQFVDPRFNQSVYAFRMPGYPLFVAALQADLKWVRIAQCVIDASTVLATLWLARRWLTPGVSYLAAIAVALDPIHLYFSSLILSESLFTSLITWGIACLVHGRSISARGRGGAIWWGGLALLIASIYVRPSAIVWPVVIIAAAMIHEAHATHFKPGRRMPVLTLVALLTALALLPWGIRNRALLGEWLFTTTNDGFTLYDSWNRDASGVSDQSHIQALPLVTGLTEVQRSRYLRSLAWESVRASPVRVVLRVPTNLQRLWTPWPLSAEFGSKRLYVIGAACHAIPLFACALIGLFRPALPRGARLLLMTPILLVTIAHGLTLGSLRYRMPIHPELAVLAASVFVRAPRVMTEREPLEA